MAALRWRGIPRRLAFAEWKLMLSAATAVIKVEIFFFIVVFLASMKTRIRPTNFNLALYSDQMCGLPVPIC